MIDTQTYQTEIFRLCTIFDYSISKEKADEYYNKFRGFFCADSFVRTIDYLIDTFKLTAYKKFPTIQDFYEGKRLSYKNEYQPSSSSEYTSLKITQAWAVCFRLGWLMVDGAKRKDYWTHLCEHGIVESSKTEERVIEYYRGKYIEARDYLRSVGIEENTIKATVRSKNIVPEHTDEQLVEINGW